MPFNSEASKISNIKTGLSSMAGFNQKAVIEIGDFSGLKLREKNAAKPSAGSGGLPGGGMGDLPGLDTGGFSLQAVKNYAKSIGVGGDDSFELYGNLQKFRFECQFNPNELYINGYGGEELPIQKYRTAEDMEEAKKKREGGGAPEPKQGDENKIHGGSTMASATTRIDMSFKIVFDKSNPQDAFFSDKFSLSATNIGKGVARAALKGTGKLSNSVQPEVEALTAIVRNGKRRLTRFVWGDMAYEGVLNSVNAEYVMFNINGEPCRAFVSLSMVLYDQEVAGANTDIWQAEYQTDFWSLAPPI